MPEQLSVQASDAAVHLQAVHDRGERYPVHRRALHRQEKLVNLRLRGVRSMSIDVMKERYSGADSEGHNSLLVTLTDDTNLARFEVQIGQPGTRDLADSRA